MKLRTLSLRRGRVSDAPRLAALRDSLRLAIRRDRDPRCAVGGGFLLGCSEDAYRAHAAGGRLVVLERCGEVAGFAVTLPNAVLRGSELWARRDRITWTADDGVPQYLDSSLAYFDQLAVAPVLQARIGAPALAFVSAERELRDHELLFATVVERPILNPAALPLVRRVGGQRVGEVAEEHPALGTFVSGIYVVSRDGFHDAVARLRAEGTPAEKAILRFVESSSA